MRSGAAQRGAARSRRGTGGLSAAQCGATRGADETGGLGAAQRGPIWSRKGAGGLGQPAAQAAGAFFTIAPLASRNISMTFKPSRPPILKTNLYI